MTTDLAKQEAFLAGDSLENGLARLAQYGNPRVSRMGGQGQQEWHCAIDMFIQGKGVEFKIQSDFKHSTPNEAVSVCLGRMKQALLDLGITL